jgi:hypothetical protein
MTRHYFFRTYLGITYRHIWWGSFTWTVCSRCGYKPPSHAITYIRLLWVVVVHD